MTASAGVQDPDVHPNIPHQCQPRVRAHVERLGHEQARAAPACGKGLQFGLQEIEPLLLHEGDAEQRLVGAIEEGAHGRKPRAVRRGDGPDVQRD